MSHPKDPHPLERSIYLEAAELESPAEQEAYLDQACGGDRHLRERVEHLLNFSDAESFAPAFTEQELLLPSSPDPEDNYQIGPELARGGMGSIRQAEDRKLKRSVALKIMHSHVGADPAAAARFVREAEVLALLSHPNIVPIHDIVWENEHPLFYTMKLVKGRTLQKIINELREKRPETLAEYDLDHLLGVFLKVCDAIAFAHSRGIIHRDLKPENIMVGEFGEVLVMDWGIAKILHRADDDLPETATMLSGPDDSIFATLQGDVMGTPQYMSPEQAEGNIEELNEQSDIFSLGGILYAILTLRPPVEGKTTGEVLAKVSRGEITSPTDLQTTRTKKMRHRRTRRRVIEIERFKPLPHTPAGRIPARLSAVVMRALALQRVRRYPSVAEFSADIDAFRTGFATSVEEAGLATQLFLLFRRHKGVFSTVLAAIFLIAVLSSGFLFKVNAEKTAALRSEANAEKEAHNAREAEKLASEAEDKAKASLAQAKVALAEMALANSDPQNVLRHLEECPEEYRDESWHYLKRESDREIHNFDDLLRGVAADARHPGHFFTLDQEGDGLRRYDARSGEFLDHIPVTRGYDYLAISPDGSQLATIERQGNMLTLFGTHPLVQTRAFKLVDAGNAGGTPFFFSGNGDHLFTTRVVDGYQRLIIDPATGEHTTFLEGFAPSIAERDSPWILGNLGGKIAKVHVETREVAWTTKPVTGYGRVYSISADGKYLFYGVGDGRVEVKNYRNGDTIRVFSAHSGRIDAILTGNDPSCFLTFGDGLRNKTIRLWNSEGENARPVREYFAKIPNQSDPSIAWDSRSGLVLCGLGGASVFQTPNNPASEVASGSPRRSVFFLDDDTLAGSQTKACVVWDLKNRDADGRPGELHEIPILLDLVRSRTRDVLLATGLRNAESSELNPGRLSRITSAGHEDIGISQGYCDNCGVSPGAEYVAMGNSWMEQLFRQTAPGKWEKFYLGGDPRRLNLNLLSSGTRMLFPFADTPRYLVSYLVLGEGSNYRHLELYDIEKREQIWTKNLPHGSEAMLLDPEGKILYTGSPDGSVRGYDPLTLDPYFAFRAHDRDISVIAISADGGRMATGEARGLIRVWEMEEGKPVRLWDELITCGGKVRAIDISPSGGKLTALSGDKIQLWHLREEPMPDYREK